MLTTQDIPASATNASEEAGNAEPSEWLERHGDLMFRYALSRVRRREVAEDLVQEALLAAWQSRQRFAGRSSQRTWLLGILRHKILDHFRRTSREVEFDNVDELEALEEKQFKTGANGPTHWNHGVAPRGWSHPAQNLENSEFWSAVRDCSERLPERTARVFVLREVDGMETDEICQTLNIKSSHLFVLMHRARLAMRRCLELNWFRTPPHSTRKSD